MKRGQKCRWEIQKTPKLSSAEKCGNFLFFLTMFTPFRCLDLSSFQCALLLSHSVMSDSVRPHKQQPTRLPHPWDSPDKNTGVGCHFLLQCMKVKSESEVVQSCLTLSDPMDCSLPGSSLRGIFQARGLEQGAIAFSIQCAQREVKTWEWKRNEDLFLQLIHLQYRVFIRFLPQNRS